MNDETALAMRVTECDLGEAESAAVARGCVLLTKVEVGLQLRGGLASNPGVHRATANELTGEETTRPFIVESSSRLALPLYQYWPSPLSLCLFHLQHRIASHASARHASSYPTCTRGCGVTLPNAFTLLPFSALCSLLSFSPVA